MKIRTREKRIIVPSLVKLPPRYGNNLLKMGRRSEPSAPAIMSAAAVAGEREREQLLTPDIARAYLSSVMDTFKDENDKRQEFLKVINFLNEGIAPTAVIAKVKDLLKGHPELILRFNVFLPHGYKISLAVEVEKHQQLKLKQPVEFCRAVTRAVTFGNKISGHNEHAYVARMDARKHRKTDRTSRTGEEQDQRLAHKGKSLQRADKLIKKQNKVGDGAETSQSHDQKDFDAFEDNKAKFARVADKPIRKHFQVEDSGSSLRGFSKEKSREKSSNLQRPTPSYRFQTKLLPSHCTQLDASVLNNSLACVKPAGGANSEYSSENLVKNKYEKILFSCEDEQFELDRSIEQAAATIKRVTELVDYIAQAPNHEHLNKSAFLLRNNLSALDMTCIELIYGPVGLEVFDTMTNSASALRLLLICLKRKHDEWSRQRSEMNKVWAETYANNYRKSLQHSNKRKSLT